MSNTHINYIAGSLSGLVEVSISHPIDRIKTALQESTLNHHNTTLKTVSKNIYKSYGLRGFYNGYIPRIIGIIPMRLTYWGTFRTMNEYISNKNFFGKIIIPGFVAGSAQTLIDNPIEVIKIKLMTGGLIPPLKTLYRGFIPCLNRNILFAIPVGITTSKYGNKHPFLSGAIGGIIGSFISHPFDVIKTEIQRHNGSSNSQIKILKDIYTFNPKKLWSGISMRASLGCINMGIGFFSFNYIHKFCNTYLTVLC